MPATNNSHFCCFVHLVRPPGPAVAALLIDVNDQVLHLCDADHLDTRICRGGPTREDRGGGLIVLAYAEDVCELTD